MNNMTQEYLGENLIFIISQPRSGSTLLQRVLFGHPDIQTSAETWLMLHPVYSMKSTGISAEYGAHFAREGIEEFIENYSSNKDIYSIAIREWARIIYNDAISKNNKKIFLDKTPRYFFIIPELYKLFPKAKFIFLIRNPLAVLASELTTYVKENWPVLGVFSHDLLHAPQWILDGIKLLGKDAIVIKYEDFVSSPNESIHSLCEKLDIKFYEEMLDYSKTPKPKGKMNDPTGINQHTKPSTDSLNKWKEMVNDPQSLYFAQSYLTALGQDTIQNLGYSYEELHSALFCKELEKSKLFPWDIAMRDQSSWTFMEKYTAEKYFLKKEKGDVLGTAAAIKRIMVRAIQNLKEQMTYPSIK